MAIGQKGMSQRKTTASQQLAGIPELSIVVASRQTDDLASFLKGLTQQVGGQQIEIIVAGCQPSTAPGNSAADYPGVTFIQLPEKATLPRLFQVGISRSRGRVIALTDTTCEPDPGWVRAILEAHKAPAPVIGGAVEMNGTSRLIDWAAYFCDYGQFMLPLRNGPATEVPGNNLSFKRRALDEGREFTGDGFWKTYWCRKLQEEGIELELRPSIVVYYKGTLELIPFLVRRFHHGRCFAGMRVARVSLLMRVAYAAGSFLLPFVFFWRTVSRVVPKKRYLTRFFLSLPIIALAVVSWSVGECSGYLWGTGKSCAHVV
jgi:hypothetical protein